MLVIPGNKLCVQVLHNLDSRDRAYRWGDKLVLVWEGVTDPGPHAEICGRVLALHTGAGRPKAHVIRPLATGDVIAIPEIGYWALESHGWRRVRIEQSTVPDRSDATEATEIYAVRVP